MNEEKKPRAGKLTDEEVPQAARGHNRPVDSPYLRFLCGSCKRRARFIHDPEGRLICEKCKKPLNCRLNC